MNKKDIQLIYRYNSWANERILKAAARISTEQFTASASYSHRDLRATLTHTLFAEWIWRTRWEGTSPTKRINAEDFPDLAALTNRWMDEEAKLMEFVDALTDEKLNSTFQYITTEGTPRENILWQSMTHVVNHGTQHRSEAAAMLTELGQSPGDIDMIVFLREDK